MKAIITLESKYLRADIIFESKNTSLWGKTRSKQATTLYPTIKIPKSRHAKLTTVRDPEGLSRNAFQQRRGVCVEWIAVGCDTMVLE